MQELARGVDGVRRFPSGTVVPSRIAPVIRDDELDVLVYPELGMDATTFALAALRLAPLQCAAWGHPVTTGHATIDVFLSCAAMEAPGAAAHYTERLLLLPGIGTEYARPEVPADAGRARFGLPEGVPLFLCPQSLFKIHPDNDPLFARVLAAAPGARMVVFEGRHPALTAKYRARLGVALAAEGLRIDERLIVLPQCGHDEYLRINAACDAMLDTVRWSGGNTALDAVAAGLPIVTLPGTFMRGRQSAGMLSLAGVDELIARDPDDYVRIAARLATDAQWRSALAGADSWRTCAGVCRCGARARARRSAAWPGPRGVTGVGVQASADVRRTPDRGCSISAAATSRTTASQSPGPGCRKSRAVGYHGLSVRTSCQRQSGANGSRIHTGLARAPARCATLVSTLTTRSSSATSAAVSSKSYAARKWNHRLRGEPHERSPRRPRPAAARTRRRRAP